MDGLDHRLTYGLADTHTHPDTDTGTYKHDPQFALQGSFSLYIGFGHFRQWSMDTSNSQHRLHA